MALATTLGVAAAAAYLEGKFNVRKDITGLYSMRAAERNYAKVAAEKKISLFYPFEEQVNRLPESERCIWSRTGCFTWRETYAMVCRYAQFLLSIDGRPGELVAFYLTNSPEFIFSMIGTWAAGTAPALINYNLGGEGLIHCLKVSGSRILLVDEDSDCRKRIEEVRDRIEGELGMKIVILDAAKRLEIEGLPPTRPSDRIRDDVAGTDPTMLLYTSGTTGLPKGIAFNNMRSWINNWTYNKADGNRPGPNGGTYYDPMPMYHGTGCVVAQQCLCNGTSLAIGKKFRTSTFWDDVRDSGATAFVYVGETARYLLAAPPSPRDKDHKVSYMFGNGLRPDVWEEFQTRFGVDSILEFFNSSEGVFALGNYARGPFRAKSVGHHGGLLRFLLRNVFVPVAVDPDDNSILRDPETGFAIRQPYEVGGEILVAIPDKAAFNGYKGAKEATEKKYAYDVFKKGDLYYRSGDSLRRDGDGRWYFMDRLGDTFRWKSENVSTAEVAIAMGSFPGVVEANVYGVLLPKHDGRAGCAAVYIPPGNRDSFDFKGLHSHLGKVLPRYAVPVFLRLVVDMNPMHNGKQSKTELRKEGADPKAIENGHSPGDKLLWAKPGTNTYTPFTQSDWDQITAGKAKL